ncbi:MAG: GntR family transcriptional regulator [Chloroflexi bacterium]|nr:GntR family transcriptional regulator [Chloroflexota bacterium]
MKSQQDQDSNAFAVEAKSLSHQVAKRLEEIIETLKPDDKLPSELELQKMFMVSRTTVRDALSQLQRAGVIRKVHGIGTFVAKRNLVISGGLDELASATEMIKQAGYLPGTSYASIGIVEVPNEIIEALGVSSYADIRCIRRIRTANEVPVMACEDYFKEEDLSLLDWNDIYHLSLTSYVEKTLGKRLAYADAFFSGNRYKPELLSLLEWEKNVPHTSFIQLHYDQNNNCVFCSDVLVRTDIIGLRIRRTRK